MVTALHGQYRPHSIGAIIFGTDSLASLPDEIDRLGRSRAFIVTGNSVATKTSVLHRVQEVLGPRDCGVYPGIRERAPVQGIIDGVAEARAAKADIIIGLGGSSATDAAKIVGFMLSEGLSTQEDFEHHRPGAQAPRVSVAPPTGAPTPTILIPTTLSAGEFTNAAGANDEASGRRLGIIDEGVAPKAIILDPSLAVETPDQLWCSTGIKALDHAIEMICSLRHQPATDGAALTAIPMLFRYLPPSHANPSDTVAKGQCQVAAWLSIWGNNNTFFGLSHAIGHSLGTRFGVPHGVTSCITLPHVMRYNLPQAEDRLSLVASAITGRPTPGKDAPDLVEELITSLGLPFRMRDVGIERKLLPEIPRGLTNDRSFKTNPRRPASEEDTLSLLHAAW